VGLRSERVWFTELQEGWTLVLLWQTSIKDICVRECCNPLEILKDDASYWEEKSQCNLALSWVTDTSGLVWRKTSSWTLLNPAIQDKPSPCWSVGIHMMESWACEVLHFGTLEVAMFLCCIGISRTNKEWYKLTCWSVCWARQGTLLVTPISGQTQNSLGENRKEN
jgi:hypothetical protein